ncbi:hypothetical protein chiPu_0007029 [Chiloscyllium punctatum]|uniref:Uncharacterized protein n=1 Tax=Chiloscyllium punctatum TaxID=137246 RepID=A0A401SDX9_CHIPU|nr:hypothetical protein [Chiloscyllium punctatum]
MKVAMEMTFVDHALEEDPEDCDMSEEEKKSEDDIDEEEEETITAVAPAVILQEEEPADVTTSPAFQCLDERKVTEEATGCQSEN